MTPPRAPGAGPAARLRHGSGGIALAVSLIACAMLALSALAFWPSYLSRWRSASAMTHGHAVLGLGWLLVLVAQSLLVRAGRVRTHRLLGRGAAALGAAFVLSGIGLAHQAARAMDSALFEREGHALYLPLAMAVLFAAALALGLAWRSVPAVHGRFMACTLLPLLDPVLARIVYVHAPPLPIAALHQVPAFALACAALVVLSVSLPKASRGRAAFLAFAASTPIVLALFFMTPYSSAWFTFVTWFRALPLS
jgi:hypothetical protein